MRILPRPATNVKVSTPNLPLPAGFVEVGPGVARRPGKCSWRHQCKGCGSWGRSLITGLCNKCVRKEGRRDA